MHFRYQTKLKVPSPCQLLILYQLLDSPCQFMLLSTEQMLQWKDLAWECSFSPLVSSTRLFRKQCKELFLALYSQEGRVIFSLKYFLSPNFSQSHSELTRYVLKFKANPLKTGKHELYIACYFFSFYVPLIYLCVHFTFMYPLLPWVERECSIFKWDI